MVEPKWRTEEENQWGQLTLFFMGTEVYASEPEVSY